jgi:hypothetical protein
MSVISVTKLTGIDLMQKACSFTMGGKESKATLQTMYKCEHSPIRTQIFCIEMHDIPTFASVHFRTHKIGMQHFDEDEHFVKSNREDLPSHSGDGGRWQPVSHMIICNAQSLISMSRKRLCQKAHSEVRKIMSQIRAQVSMVDQELAKVMVPDCIYRNSCNEIKPCGLFPGNISKGGRDTW